MCQTQIEQIVRNLIATGREDDWWDFKETYHGDKASLLHDIICLANNRADRDAYLIFGVRDKTMEIMGVENDPNRKNQQNIVDFLRAVEFAGQLRPRVEIRTLFMEEHQLDVFIIKNSTDVPYYLAQSYFDKKYKSAAGKAGKTVEAYYIYTRVMDNNTPINKSADPHDVEYLWKKRFGLLQTPLNQIMVLLQKPDEWIEEDSKYYHMLFPQYTIEICYDEDEDDSQDNKEFYHYQQCDSTTRYGILKIHHYATQLFSCQITSLDGYRMIAPCPIWEVIENGDSDRIGYKYYLRHSMEYLLLRFLEYKKGKDNGGEAQIATKKLLKVVLIFNEAEHIKSFNRYVLQHIDSFNKIAAEQRVAKIFGEPENVAQIQTERIRNGKALKIMQADWNNLNTAL